MSTDKAVINVGGASTLGLLGVVFVTLKLCGVIDWSWWAVTAPFWGGAAVFLAILVLITLAIAFAGLGGALYCFVTRK